MPNLEAQVQAAPVKPAIAESAPAAPPAPPRPAPAAPVSNGAAARPAGSGKDGDEDWWTE
jgi:hypothetical protein